MESQTSLLGTVDQQVSRYKHVLNIMPAGVILLNPHGLIAEANPEAYRLLGEPLENERWLDVIHRAFSPKDDDGHEVSLKNGRRVKLAISASDLGQLILITDLTETRLLQSRLSDLQRLSSLGKMVASLAHQVRTPLSSALLYAENLGSAQIKPEMRQRFQQKLVARLHDLEKQVNDMLLFAKGGDHQVVQIFHLYALLDELESMVEAIIHAQKIHFEINCEDENLQLFGNLNALASALSNLVVNAAQLAGNGCEIIIDIRQIEDEVFLSVADNGPGISPEVMHKITEPFFTTRDQGTGLGLAVVQMVCHAHKGRLNVQSELGCGACFTICIPHHGAKDKDNQEA